MFNSIIALGLEDKESRKLPLAPGVLLPPFTYFKFNRRLACTGRGWLVLISCPYCGNEHLHGGCPKIKDLVPTRKSHCDLGGEYVLKIKRGK